MQNFTFHAPTVIYFGKGQIEKLGDAVAAYGKRTLIVYGSERVRKSGLLDRAAAQLKQKGIESFELGGVQPNPRIDLVREGVRLCRELKIDFVLAVGGGSVLDSAKAVAAGSKYDGDAWDFYARKARAAEALPVGAVLTLAATGSEMNGNSVISNPGTEEKHAIGETCLLPKFSILDPELTYTVPAYQTAAGIVDIMSHVYEQYFSPTPDTFVQDRLSEAVLKTCVEFGPVALRKPDDYNARANILWAGTLALNGLLSQGKTGDWATHGIEHVLSGIYDVTHGAGLAVLTPHWMNYVLDDTNAGRFYDHAVNVWNVAPSNDRIAVSKEGIRRMAEFFASLGMPETLRELGVEESRLENMAAKTVTSGNKGSLKTLGKADVLAILKAAY